MPVTIRTATPDDAPEVFRLIHELAVYEKLDASVRTDARGVRDAMESDTPRIFVLLAEDAETGRAVGFALYFFTFSTFEGAPTLYLEDIFVEPSSRGTGIGSRLLGLLARAAREKGCRRMEWTALDWNASARTFYENLGAVPLNDWIIHRLGAEAIETMAHRATDRSGATDEGVTFALPAVAPTDSPGESPAGSQHQSTRRCPSVKR